MFNFTCKAANREEALKQLEEKHYIHMRGNVFLHNKELLVLGNPRVNVRQGDTFLTVTFRKLFNWRAKYD